MAQDDFRSLLEKLRAASEHLEQNVTLSARQCADIAETEAKQHHDYTDRSGLLTGSIAADGPRGSFANDTLEAVVAAGAPYGIFIEKGTKKHKVEPKYRKFLRWEGPGGYFFSKGHEVRGIRARKFLENAANKTLPQMTERIIPEAIELSFVQAGFDRGT